MKKMLYLFLAGVLLVMPACTPKQTNKDAPSAPLHTGQQVAPPAGCAQLRKDGGAC